MILWFLDRFGLPGSYQRIWVKMLAEQGISVKEVRAFSLHRLLNRTLLTKYGTRKAPTWLPDEELSICNMIDGLIGQFKPRAVVLAAPEALAVLGLNPEHATLHNLRGSVYWRHGLPHIVMLPMSAWNSLVSQKEIGAANYGYETQEAFLASQTAGTGTTIDSQSSDRPGQAAASGLRGGVGQGNESPNGAGTARGNSASLSGNEGAGRGAILQASQYHPSGNRRSGDSSGPVLPAQASPVSGIPADGKLPPHLRDSTRDSVLDRQLRGRGSEGADGSGDADAASGVPETDEGRPGLHAVGEERVSEDDLPYIVDGRPDADDVDAEDGESDSPEADADDTPADEEGGDQFFYEPVLSPVGRFAITADAAKLKRILDSGRKADGPSKPLVLNWR